MTFIDRAVDRGRLLSESLNGLEEKLIRIVQNNPIVDLTNAMSDEIAELKTDFAKSKLPDGGWDLYVYGGAKAGWVEINSDGAPVLTEEQENLLKF